MNQSTEKRTALIIGGSGLLGRGIARELRDAGWTVTLLTRGRQPVPPDLRDLECLCADRGSAEALRNGIGARSFNLVIDCAAYSLADAEAAVACFSGTVDHYFFIGSDFVYAPTDEATLPVVEDAPKLKNLPYATGKLEAESYLLEQAANRDFPVTLLRPPHILGDGRPLGCDPFAGGRDPALPERLRAGEELPLILGGQFLIQPVWSREVGRIVHHLFVRPETFGRILNCAGDEIVTVRTYYRMVAECLGAEASFRPVSLENFLETQPEKAHIARHRFYSLKGLNDLGYEPHMSLRDAISETLQSSH